MRKWHLISGAGALIAVGTAVAGTAVLRDPGRSCLDAELERAVGNGANVEHLPPAGRDESIAWASDTAGYDVRMPCYLPDDLVMRGISVDVSPAFEVYWGRRVDLTVSSKEEADTKYITGPFVQIAQFPKQGPPEDMDPISLGVGETAAWKREATTIEPPGSDQSSSSFAFYLVHRNGGSISVQMTTPPGELPPEAEVRRIIQSMFDDE
jgi:hypothetical protein